MTPLALIAELVAGSPGLATIAVFGLVGVTLLLFAWASGLLAAIPRSGSVSGAPPASGQIFVRLSDPDAPGRARARAPTESRAPA